MYFTLARERMINHVILRTFLRMQIEIVVFWVGHLFFNEAPVVSLPCTVSFYSSFARHFTIPEEYKTATN